MHDLVGACRAQSDVCSILIILDHTQTVEGDLQKTLASQHQLRDTQGEASTTYYLGELAEHSKNSPEAFEDYKKALSLYKQAHDPLGMANAHQSLGRLYYSLKLADLSLASYKAALSLYESLHNEYETASVHINRGHVYLNLRDQPDKAFADYEVGRRILLSLDDKNGLQNAVYAEAMSQESRRNPRPALQLYAQALILQREIGLFPVESETLYVLARMIKESNPRAAAWLSILSLRETKNQPKPGSQRERRKSSQELLHRFVLAQSLLISQERVTESEQVVFLEKNDQFRSEAELPFSNLEFALTQKYEKRINKIVADRHALSSASRTLKGKHSTSVRSLEHRCQLETAGFVAFLERVTNSFPASSFLPGRPASTEASTEIQKTLARLPSGAAVVYVVPEGNTVHLLLERRGEAPLLATKSCNNLNQLISDFRKATQDITTVSPSSGEALYSLIVSPIEPYLSHNAPTAWYLSGITRNIPLNALRSGSKYLIENFPSCEFNPGYIARLSQPANPLNNHNAVFAPSYDGLVSAPLSDQNPSFVSLRTANLEGSFVARQLGTKPIPDSKFTKEELMKVLEHKPEVVHIIAHYMFAAGDDRKAFILLGNGKALTLDEIESKSSDLLSGIQLITFSSCDAGLGEGLIGEEADGLADWSLKKGALAVITSNLRVPDDGTTLLMMEFYHQRKLHPELPVYMNLRNAQLRMLSGETAGDLVAEMDLTPDERKEYSLRIYSSKSFAHPCYWASFMVRGNCR